MSWKKHFRFVDSKSTSTNVPKIPQDKGSDYGNSSAKYSSYLPEVYAGHPQRIQRYYQYADMDKDCDINVALNLIADFCTQSEEQSDEPFDIKYIEEGNETEVKLIKQCMAKWIKVNNFRRILYHIFRGTILNGDAFFLRDPETQEWLWLDHFNVMSVTVDQDKGKVPSEYVVRGLDYSQKARYATQMTDTTTTAMGTASTAYAGRVGGSQSGGSFQLAGSHLDNRQNRPGQPGSGMDITIVDAKNIVHLSLSIGMDTNWPFGKSVLDPIYKVYKQKEMLEDSIIIYRVQRAPERRVFKIDVGDMPPQKAQAYIAKIKNEIHQRRLPNRTGGGGSMVDSAYNPLAMMDDYFFAVTPTGRGSSIETLPGGEGLGEVGDLDYFTDKFARGMGIPPNYLAISKDRGSMFNDGKGGAAMIDEYRFNKYCMRLQALLEPKFDEEFKKFVEASGVIVDNSLFELRFRPPQNFSKYRQIDLDTQQISVYSQLASNTKISERMKFTRYLNWDEEDILQNETWWKEENPEKMKKKTGSAANDGAAAPSDGLGAVGVSSGSDFDFDDLNSSEDLGDGAEGGSPPTQGPGTAADPGVAPGADGGGSAAPPV